MESNEWRPADADGDRRRPREEYDDAAFGEYGGRAKFLGRDAALQAKWAVRTGRLPLFDNAPDGAVQRMIVIGDQGEGPA